MNLPDLGARFAPVLAFVLGMCVLAGLAAIRIARRRARTTGFGFVRERALYRARRWMIGTGLLALLGAASAGLWAVAVYRPEILPTPMPTATSTLIPTPTPRPPTATPTPTAPPTVTPTATATAAPVDAELPALLRRSHALQTSTPASNAVLAEVTMAAGERGNRPVNPTVVFPPGTRRVYAFLLFDGMADGVAWTHVWYREVNGEMQEVWGKTEPWSRDYAHGQVWRYFDCGVGNHELRVYVGHELQVTVPFVVQGG